MVLCILYNVHMIWRESCLKIFYNIAMQYSKKSKFQLPFLLTFLKILVKYSTIMKYIFTISKGRKRKNAETIVTPFEFLVLGGQPPSQAPTPLLPSWAGWSWWTRRTPSTHWVSRRSPSWSSLVEAPSSMGTWKYASFLKRFKQEGVGVSFLTNTKTLSTFTFFTVCLMV